MNGRTVKDLSATSFAEYTRTRMEADIIESIPSIDMHTFRVRRSAILRIVSFLRDDKTCRFTQLTDLFGVDYFTKKRRFDVVYHLLSHSLNQRVRLVVSVEEGTPVPSVTPVFEAAGWYERETWDMYGILFSGHPDLRRLLTEYDFSGHPLRKDFPLHGHAEIRYDEETSSFVTEPVSAEVVEAVKAMDNSRRAATQKAASEETDDV